MGSAAIYFAIWANGCLNNRALTNGFVQRERSIWEDVTGPVVWGSSLKHLVIKDVSAQTEDGEYGVACMQLVAMSKSCLMRSGGDGT